MSSSKILGNKDVNASLADGQPLVKDVKSMEYHRQVFQSKIAQDPSKQYVSPSDTIMSPCTAKLSALRNKQVTKAKPKSLFAQASAKKLHGGNLFGARPSQTENPLGARSAQGEGSLTSRVR
ncbi:spo12 family domain-containing [Trichoderma arundinaceum]|uniref:Spo12 family domain-containing n=1 Tax=Trichoderma arundinaceum TaxID=490622 RepID=A0A395NZW7_TRIAR|nr:spo12 family domain-containing [Trichoderma arundinaceum]